MSEIWLKLKNLRLSYFKMSYGSGFWDTDRKVATVVMATEQPIRSQFKNCFSVIDWELNKVYVYQK